MFTKYASQSKLVCYVVHVLALSQPSDRAINSNQRLISLPVDYAIARGVADFSEL